MYQTERGFDLRGTLECGWNLFCRKGYSNHPRDISVNRAYMDHLAESGLNRLVVFWTNARGFSDAWHEAVKHAHAVGLKLIRAIYGFSGGGSEYTMAEPDAPPLLLRRGARGSGTALCPHDAESRAWMGDVLSERLAPGVDGIDIEPAREIGRNCVCERCLALRPFQWDALVIGFLVERIHAIKPDAEILLHLSMPPDKPGKQQMSRDLQCLPESIRHIFAWGADDEASLVEWLDADSRFEHFAKLGRVLLFPDGTPGGLPVEERVARTFRWCRLAADRGKTGYLFDYRIFGGREWQGHETDVPHTRQCSRLPASIALMGAALTNPYLNEDGRLELIARLKSECDWDLEDPARFYNSPAE